MYPSYLLLLFAALMLPFYIQAQDPDSDTDMDGSEDSDTDMDGSEDQERMPLLVDYLFDNPRKVNEDDVKGHCTEEEYTELSYALEDARNFYESALDAVKLLGTRPQDQATLELWEYYHLLYITLLDWYKPTAQSWRGPAVERPENYRKIRGLFTDSCPRPSDELTNGDCADFLQSMVDYFNAPFKNSGPYDTPDWDDIPTHPERQLFCGEGWKTFLRPDAVNPLYDENDSSSPYKVYEIEKFKGM